MGGLLNNPWVVGIGGGVLSGFLVAVFSRYLFQKRDNREYAQKVASVNREVLYALRPGISEGMIPSISILISLIASTARRYGVDEKDAYSPIVIADELIKEVMDSSFISSKAKNEFCESIVRIKQEGRPVAGEAPAVSEAFADYRRRMMVVMSTMLGLVTAAMTGFLALSKTEGLVSVPFALAVPFAAGLGAALIATAIREITRKDRERRRDEGEKDKGKKGGA